MMRDLRAALRNRMLATLPILALFLTLVPLPGASTREEVLALIAPLAAALANGDAGAFMSAIPDDVPERPVLAANVDGLLAAALITSSATVLAIGEGEAQFDWYIEIRSRSTETVIERRRQRVTVRFADEKLKALQPVSFFAPPRLE